MKKLEIERMEGIVGGSRGAQGVLDCIGGVYGGFGWFSVAAIAVSIAEPGFGLAIVGGCMTAMR